MSVREKVINGLLFIYRKFGQTDNYFNITLSRNDIADFAGTSRDQVIRVISALKKEGLLISKGKNLGIQDLEAFEAALNHKEPFLEG
jgi:CRP-like cAMP-binding protein